MPRLVCFFAFVLLLAGGVHSRDTIPNTDDMVRTAYPDFIPELYRYIDLIYASDLETARILCERLRTSALAVGSKEWKLEADFLEAGYLILHELVPPEVSLATYDSLFEDSRDVNMPIFRLHVLVGYFNLLWSTNDYENAFSLLREFKQLLEDVSTEDFFRKPHYFYRAGEAYYHFNDYSEAMKMLRPLVDLPMSATMKVPKFHSINMIGLIHQDRGVLDSAEYYFQRVLNLGIATGDSAWIGIASGNLGKNAFLRGDFEEAIPLLRLDFDLAIKHQDLGLAAGSGVVLADIYLRKEMPETAKEFLNASYEYIHRSNQLRRLRHFYPVMAKYQAGMGDPGKTIAYLDSAETHRAHHEKEFNAFLLMRVRQNEHQAQMDELKAEEARQRFVWILMVSATSLVVIALSILLYFRRKQSRMRHEMAEMDRLRQAHKLEEAQLQLNRFADQIVRNKAIIEELRDEARSKKAGALKELRQSRILTEADWNLFRDRFNTVHGAFSTKLEARFPHLTQGEFRFLSLAKLGLSKSEIASALGVSTSSLRVTWYRIRKKIDLPEGATPEDFVREMSEDQSGSGLTVG